MPKINPSKMELEMNEQNPNEGPAEKLFENRFEDFNIIDYVLVYKESTSAKSKNKLEGYRQIYLENLVSYGLKLKQVKSYNCECLRSKQNFITLNSNKR